MITKAELIDSYIQYNFMKAYECARKIGKDELAGFYVALALKDLINLGDSEAQMAIETLKSFWPLFVRYVHAEILAALFSQTLIVDSYFGVLFDEKTKSLRLNNLSTEYLITLISYYIEVVSSKQKSIVPDEFVPLIQKIWPLYNLSLLSR